MDALEKIKSITGKLNDAKKHIDKDSFKKKHKKRQKFYTLLYDYINSSGGNSPANFFDWYLSMLDKRMDIAPQWMSAWYKVTKSKNEPGLREFLEDCSKRLEFEPNFYKAIKPWIPDDEYRIISGSTTADISEVLEIAIGICEEKQEMQDVIHSSVFSNIPIIAMGLFFHWIIYSFIYETFISPSFTGDEPWATMTFLEKNYVLYQFVVSNYILIGIGLVGFSIFLNWSVKNWSSRGVFFREHYMDYIPPYSLYKVSEQYNILMIMSNYMKSGKSFSESLEEVRSGSKEYIKHQMDKIINNSTAQAHVAINTFFLGSPGSEVSDRGNHVALEKAIEEMLPKLREEKNEKFKKIISISMKIVFKPVIYGSIVFALIPAFMEIAGNIPSSTSGL